MPQLRNFALVLLIPFSALTLYALMEVGYIGIFDYHRHSPAGWQVFADLVVALLLPPPASITSSKAEPGTRSVPMNIRCSNRCAKPVRPLGSSLLPT